MAAGTAVSISPCPEASAWNMVMTHDDYNYAAYRFDMEGPELECWQRSAPALGQLAPDFDLESIDGTPLRLSDLRGRAVVLEFGSYTCPIFCGRIRAMDSLAAEFPDATFLTIYIREAHPGEKLGPHASMGEKRTRALQMRREERVQRAVLVDDTAGTVHRSYGGGWDPVFIIDAAGRVVLRRLWNDPEAVRSVLATGGAGATDSVEFTPPPPRDPAGVAFLDRGGKQSLLDFYLTAPPPMRARIEASESTDVRAVLASTRLSDA